MTNITQIKKRDGRVVDFDKTKIADAIFKAAQAVGGENRELAERLSDLVLERVEKAISPRVIPTVEEVQDAVEKMLIEEGHAKTAKAYILYRDQRTKIREMKSMVQDMGVIEGYINEEDWRVKENSNMTFSLQGLDYHISSKLISNYWMQKIYPTEIRNAHEQADFHVHDLGTLGAYCVGWDLLDLLMNGFRGVSGKIETKPPKHLRSALGQVVNFFYTLQGESAGAQAMSNFDTYMAPFIRYDGLSYVEVKQAIQEFVFNMNVPTRVGFQCMSEDTEILTPDGWKGYEELKEGNTIKTFNVENGVIENKPIKRLFQRHYKGIMYNLKNRIQDQLISPGHRVVRKKFQTNKYVLEEIENIEKMKSPFIIPVAGKNEDKDANLSDDEIRLLAWIIAEGSIENYTSHRHSKRIMIYQSKIKNPGKYNEIIALLKKFKLSYGERDSTPALGNSVKMIRLNADSSRKIHSLFGTNENVGFIPSKLLNMSRRQSIIFLDTYLKADGFENCKIATTKKEILDGLQQIAVNAEYGFTVLARNPTIGKKLIYVLRLIKHKETYIKSIKKIEYDGIIWCPNTDNETVIARRNGKVFITGNTPFTNITLDMSVPEFMKNDPVIIGGKPMKETYGEFQEEIKLFDRAFAEVMMEGDAIGRPFTFPIPTICITKDFDWTNSENTIWGMTAKYGIPYFSNFVNSDMKPDDVRSMCCRLRIDNRELRKRGGGLFGANPLTGCYDEETEIMTVDGWKLFKDLTKNDTVFTLTSNNKIELHKPKKLFAYDYEGEMFHFKTKSLDLLVTPNHRMVVDQVQSKKRKFVEAADFDANNQRIPKQSIWVGEEVEWFTLPGIEFTKYGKQGKTPYQVIRDSLKIKMDDWLEFFGFWLAEGCTDNEKIAKSHGYRVVITQVNRQKREEIKRVLDNLPFNYSIEKYNFVICNKQLWTYLRNFGNTYEKYIPQEIKKLSTRQIKILFDWMVKGDGYVRKTTGQINYWTASKKLADGLQEIILKLGWLGTLTSQKKNISEIKGRKINAGIIYTLGVQKANHYRLRKNNIKKVNYKGKVYCCEVDNHTVFVRRNGRVSWCGNSIGVVTINLPRIGFFAKTEEQFLTQLEHLMILAKESLEIKRKAIEKFTEMGLYPYSRFYLRKVKEAEGQYWKNHFSTIGLVGMNEALLNFMGVGIADPEGKKFALKVLDFMRNKLQDYQQETGHIYNLEATPAEGTSYRLAMIDKKTYPNIIVANEEQWKNGTAPFYTNSTQLPVNYTDDIFEALEIQDDIQTKYTGGVVFHGFLGESMPSGEATKKLVKKIAENFHLPYYTITPTFSICPNHGYISGRHDICPTCEAAGNKVECEVYSRIVGYIRPVKQWNNGKRAEFEIRKTFNGTAKAC